MPVRRSVRPFAALAAVVVAACASSGSSSDGGDPPIPFPSGAGIQQNLTLTSLRANGWTVCLDETYATDSSTTIASLLTACAGRHLLLACTNGASNDVLQLAAADLRGVVTQVDAASPTAHHVSGTVGWYFTDDFSWGFFPAGAGVNRAPCDYDADGTQTVKDQRLCWEASAGDLSPGYRCGASVNLNSSSTWRRLVLAHP